MLNKIAVLSFSALILIGCGKASQQSATTNTFAQSSDNSVIVSGHSQNQTNSLDNAAPSAAIVPKSEMKTKWTQSGTPIDTSAFDAEIANTTKNLKSKPKDEATKKALAEAYLKRGIVLTDARQYASALGDYRRVLKYDAENEEAKKWIEVTLGVYDGMNKEAPKEGEEPPPLPFKKGI